MYIFIIPGGTEAGNCHEFKTSLGYIMRSCLKKLTMGKREVPIPIISIEFDEKHLIFVLVSVTGKHCFMESYDFL